MKSCLSPGPFAFIPECKFLLEEHQGDTSWVDSHKYERQVHVLMFVFTYLKVLFHSLHDLPSVKKEQLSKECSTFYKIKCSGQGIL